MSKERKSQKNKGSKKKMKRRKKWTRENKVEEEISLNAISWDKSILK